MDFHKLPAITPLQFFEMHVEIKHAQKKPSLKEMKRSFLLPQTAEFLNEENFADVGAAWNEEALYFSFVIKKEQTSSYYPDYMKGDAVELFINTRLLKEGLSFKFCHHFLFLPEKVAGIQALEISKFRGEDNHSLCDSSDLEVLVEREKKSYSLLIEIPRKCLVGYDPLEKKHIGLTYRIHREGGAPGHFALASSDYALEQHPKLWASGLLKEGK